MNDIDLINISSLQHLLFCIRRFYLTTIENIWEDNILTVQGTNLHINVHNKNKIKISSYKYGIIGEADIIEKNEGNFYPVEYKRGKPLYDLCYKVQLCAQALCIEEMTSIIVTKGAIFYGIKCHREEISFDDSLRSTLNTLLSCGDKFYARCCSL